MSTSLGHRPSPPPSPIDSSAIWKDSVIFICSTLSFHSIYFTSKETRHTTHVSILCMRLQSFQNKSSESRQSALSARPALLSTSRGSLLTWNFVRSLIWCCDLSKRCATVFCCCALLLHSTAALYCYALLVRSTTALHCYALLSRSTIILYHSASSLSNTSYKSVILETATDTDTTRTSERLR